MQSIVLLAWLFLIACVSKNPGQHPQAEPTADAGIEKTEKVPVPGVVTDDTDWISFVKTPHPLDLPVACADGESLSYLPCPFTLKRTIDFTAGFVEEQACSCFPNITTQRSLLDETQKADLRNLARSIQTLEEGVHCSFDASFTELNIRKARLEQSFLVSSGDITSCEGSAAYVKNAEATKLSDAVSELVQNAVLISKRALRPIFAEHRGFRLTYPLALIQDSSLCTVERSFIYRAEKQQMEMMLCDRSPGMRSQTVQLDKAGNERLIAALQSLEVPTESSSRRSCRMAPAALELYREDGTTDTYFFDEPLCDSGWRDRDSYGRQIFGPTSKDFLDIIQSLTLAMLQGASPGTSPAVSNR